jgi:hypothetical protein
MIEPPPDTRKLWRSRVLAWGAAILFLVFAAYTLKGLYHLVLDSAIEEGAAIDLHCRWQEQHYILRHKNPFVVRELYDAAKAAGAGQAECDQCLDADLGAPRPGYPPWAYGTGALVMWPSNWTAARCYFAALDLLLLGWVGFVAYRVGMPRGRPTALLFCSSVLAGFSIHSTLGTGQYGIIVLAALLGVWWFSEQQRPILAGLLLGVALVKPTLSIPFLIPMLVKKKCWPSLITAGLYLGLASCFTWWLIGVDPLTMLKYMLNSPYGALGGVDLIELLSRLGVSRGTAMKITPPVVVAVAFILSILWRRASLLTLFALAGVATRLWSYHRGYDDLIGIFLLLGLGAAALERRNVAAWAAFLSMGVTLWIPARLLGTEVGLLLLLVWVVCLAALLRVVPRDGSDGPRNREVSARVAEAVG